MPQDFCHLCQQQSELQNSHILPAFAFRWLRDSAGKGHLRSTTEPNKRVQDGIKRYWLCCSCESILNRSETMFATKIFHPYSTESGGRFRYDSWLMHFCASLSWRVLHFFHHEGHLSEWGPEELSYVNDAEEVWRELLLNERPHPATFQQHLLPVDRIDNPTGNLAPKLAPNINRYLMRAIEMDVCKDDESIYTYTKLGRFIIFGFVNEPNPKHWCGTKVNANNGSIEPKEYVLPAKLGDYLNDRARTTAEKLHSVSDKQHEKIEEHFRNNIDNYSESDACKAMLADISMFGDKAFSNRESDK